MARATVTGYCERIGTGLWDEPLNAATNLAFIAAAALLLRALAGKDRPARGDWAPWALIALVVLIGIGSALFHTRPARWTAAADVIPIGVFILLATYLALKRLVRLGVLMSLLGVAAVLGLAVGITLLIRFGGGSYLAALVTLLAIGLFLRLRRGHPAGVVLLAAAGVFAVSLTLRTLDGPLCGAMPSGTHFLWHVLNAVVLYLVALTIMRFGRPAR